MRENLVSTTAEGGPAEGSAGRPEALIMGEPGAPDCARCAAELTAASHEFAKSFEGRDFEGFKSFFVANATGLSADGTVGMNTDAWGECLRLYFSDDSWGMTVSHIKTTVQGCNSGQVLETVRFDTRDGQMTFIHVACWIREHGVWKVALQSEAGPLELRVNPLAG